MKSKKLLKLISQVIIGTLLILGVVTIAFSLILPILERNQHPILNSLQYRDIYSFLPKPYVVQSGSMEPAIKTASVVFSVPQKSYNPGDIITFAQGGNKEKLITHRIAFKLYPNGVENLPIYKTSGDANEEFDRWEVKPEDIVGRAVFSIPYLGYAVDFAKRPYGFLLLVIVPATIVIYEELKIVGREFFRFFRKVKEDIRIKIFKQFREKKQKVNEGEIGKTFINEEEWNINLSPKGETLRRSSIILPVLGSALVLISFSTSFFFDIETSIGNIFGAAESFCNQSQGHVVINEVFYDVDTLHNGQGSENDWEWVELYNPLSSTVNLTGWSIGTIGGGGDFETFTGSPSLGPCSFAIVSPSTEAQLEDQTNDGGNWTIPDGTLFITLSDFIGDNGLNNGGDNVVLRASPSATIDTMSYGVDTSQLNPAATDVSSGHSLERSPDGFDTNAASDFVDRTTPTPGS